MVQFFLYGPLFVPLCHNVCTGMDSQHNRVSRVIDGTGKGNNEWFVQLPDALVQKSNTTCCKSCIARKCQPYAQDHSNHCQDLSTILQCPMSDNLGG